MSKRFPGKYKRSPKDYYVTPAEAVLPLIPFLKAAKIRKFCEPCAGNGALVCHLEAHGFVCTYYGDNEPPCPPTPIVKSCVKQDALDIPAFNSIPITNPPFSWWMLRPLLDHLLRTADAFWFLLPLAWTANQRTSKYMARCSDVVTVKRLKFIAGSESTGTDDHAWLRFSREHPGPTLFHNGHGTPPSVWTRTFACTDCGRAFVPQRSTARFCGDACRQRAHRSQLSVTSSVTEYSEGQLSLGLLA